MEIVVGGPNPVIIYFPLLEAVENQDGSAFFLSFLFFITLRQSFATGRPPDVSGPGKTTGHWEDISWKMWNVAAACGVEYGIFALCAREDINSLFWK